MAAPSSQPPRPDDVPDRSQVLALFTAVMLPMFLAAVDQTLLATATPRIALEMGGLNDTSWIAIGYLLAATVMAPIHGRLGDRYGRRGALLAALALFGAGSLGCGLAHTMGSLIGARVVQGLGGGGLMVLSQALIGELVAPRHRPRYQGYFATVFTAASVGGPVIGGFVVNHASWRWLFLVNLPLCLLALWRVGRLPRAAPSAFRHAPFDPWGVLLFVLTACSALLWASLIGHRFAWLSVPSAALLGTALAGGVMLLRQQRRHPAPFLPLDIARVPGAVWLCLSALCFAGCLFALVFLLPIYLQWGQGVSAANSGLQLLPLTGGLVLGSLLNGRATLRSGVVTQLPPYGFGLAALALLVLGLAPAPWLTPTAMAACGLGFGTVMPSAQLGLQLLAGQSRLGRAAALLSLSRSCGAALGTAVFSGLAFALLHVTPASPGLAETLPALSLAELPPARLMHAFQTVFLVLAGLCLLAAWMARQIPVLSVDEPPGVQDLAQELA